MGDASMGRDSEFIRLAFNHQLVTSDDLCSKFRQLRTDEERISLLFEMAVDYLATLLDTKCKQKDSEHSTRLREDGNKSFKDGQYYQAIQEYTESIVYALKSSEELALAYANRSAALFKLEKYVDCVTDIDRALNLKYPDRLKAKLYKRKGLCLTALGRPGAKSSFEKALVWLEKMSVGQVEMNKSRNELRKLISVPCTFTKPSANVMQPPLPDLGTPNPEIPCASAAVSIQYTEKFGRHLVATRKIKPGEILIVEEPYCLGLIPKNIYKYCSHCLQVSWALMPCEYCVNVMYCSEACRDAAWDQYHEVECHVLGFLRSFGLNEGLEVGLRVVLIATLKGRNINLLRQELIDVECNRDPRTKGFFNGKFHSDQYRSIYSLVDNVDKKSVEEILSTAFWVALTVCVLARDCDMFGKNRALDSLAKNPDIIFVGGLLLKQVRIGCVNNHSFGASRSLSRREHGNALMALCSLVNHSCDPNVLRQWYAGRMVIFAVHPIERGEQIFESYGARFIDMPIEKRQKICKYWNFNCECIACTKNWPKLVDLLSCKEQTLTQCNKNEIEIALMMMMCMRCAHSKKIGTIENVLNMLGHLSKSIEILFNLAQRPCKELYELIDLLTEFYQSADVVYDYEQASPSMTDKLHSVFYSSIQHKFSQK